MKILFLDIDGVLNSTNDSNEIQSFMSKMHHINQENLNNLKMLVQKEDYKIVISSTWRKDKNFIEGAVTVEEIIKKFILLFKENGWDNAPIVGITPNLSGFRGEEVATYLDSLGNNNIQYLILDDDKDFIVSSLRDISLAKLDRIGIRSYEDATEKSPYWSNQLLYLVNPTTGLSKEDVEKILSKNNFKKNEIHNHTSKKMK